MVEHGNLVAPSGCDSLVESDRRLDDLAGPLGQLFKLIPSCEDKRGVTLD